jgi:hypothetical protein
MRHYEISLRGSNDLAHRHSRARLKQSGFSIAEADDGDFSDNQVNMSPVNGK